jgi:hypothetical protein
MLSASKDLRNLVSTCTILIRNTKWESVVCGERMDRTEKDFLVEKYKQLDQALAKRERDGREQD